MGVVGRVSVRHGVFDRGFPRSAVVYLCKTGVGALLDVSGSVESHSRRKRLGYCAECGAIPSAWVLVEVAFSFAAAWQNVAHFDSLFALHRIQSVCI